MKADSWKKIIDGIDEDIVDSAAERLSKPEHSTVDDMEAFTHEGKPTEYTVSYTHLTLPTKLEV